MKFIIYILIVLLSFSIHINAKEKTINELVDMIAGMNDTKMQYFFWVKDNNAYLASTKKDDVSLRVWYYTQSRKWQPIHNAGAFDGFSEAVKSFRDVAQNKNEETITFSSIIDGSLRGTALEKAKLIENTTINIGWYFWVQNGNAFLFKKINDNEIKIWYYTIPDKKWQPIHNAGAFDGYKKAPKTLESTSFNPLQGTLSTGNAIPINDSNEGIEPEIKTATYKLTFKATWNSSTHPKNFPSNPHFSPLIGGLHNDKTSIWKSGGISSLGMKSMAETGSVSSITRSMKSDKNINRIIKGSLLSPSPKQISLNFEVSSDYPYLSIVSMLAPSPDWFIGVNSLKLLDNENNWINDKTISLKLYDAGTDSGTLFNSSNIATNPQEAIKELTDKSNTDFEDGKPFVGEFILIKQ